MLSYHLIVPTLPYHFIVLLYLAYGTPQMCPTHQWPLWLVVQAPLGCRGQLHAVWLPVARGLMLLSAAPPGQDFTFNLENKISTSKYDTNNINKILYNSATLDFNINFYTV